MKSITTLLSLLLFVCLCTAQNTEYFFTPKWKVGDKRHLQIETVKEEIKDGNKEPAELEEMEADVEITKEDADNYYMTVSYENVVYRATASLYDKLDEQAKTYKRIELKYKVNKKTGEFDLVNWKEVQSIITGSIDDMTKLMKKKDKDAGSMAGLIFEPITKLFESKETITAYASDEIGYISAAFGKKLKVGDTLSVTEKVQNPFMPGDSIEGTTLTFLKSVNTDKQTCEIGGKEIIDLSAFKKMMLDMVMGMAKSLGQGEKAKEELKAFDDMIFDMQISEVLSFDYNKSWPTKYVKTTTLVMKMDKRDSDVKATKTVIFK